MVSYLLYKYRLWCGIPNPGYGYHHVIMVHHAYDRGKIYRSMVPNEGKKGTSFEMSVSTLLSACSHCIAARYPSFEL